MINSFKWFPLLLCLLLLHSMAQARPLQKDYEFLEPFNDTRLVENGLELTGSIASVSLSTLLNLGIWWGVCKTPGIVSGLASRYHLASQDQADLEDMKTNFCLQLASVVTTTEVALAGQVSPWSLEKRWWKPLYFVGAGMAAYSSYAVPKTRKLVPVAVLAYLTSEAVSRTLASATSASMLREMKVTDIATEGYLCGEYQSLSLFTGIMVGAIIYETMIHKGFKPAKAALAFAVSTAMAGTLSGIFSVATIDMDDQQKIVAGAGTGVVAVTVAIAVAIAIAGVVARAGAIARAGAGAGAGALARSRAGAGAGALTMAMALSSSRAGTLVLALTGVGALVGAEARALLMSGNSKIASNTPLIYVGVPLVAALTLAVVNSLSNYAVYGDPLEEGLSETARTQWKKFYAPLDYLSTLFN